MKLFSALGYLPSDADPAVVGADLTVNVDLHVNSYTKDRPGVLLEGECDAWLKAQKTKWRSRNYEFGIVQLDLPKYIVSTPESLKNTANMFNRYPERFLFGTDEVAPANQEKYLKIYNQYEPLWKLLSSDVSEKLRNGNYERIFDEARRSVRSWEATNVKSVSSITGGLK